MRDLEGTMFSRVTLLSCSEPKQCYDILINRFMSVPVYITNTTLANTDASIRLTNNTNDLLPVLASSIKGDFITIPYPNIIITWLLPGHTIDASLTASRGCGRDHVYYRPVQHVWITTANELIIEPLRPYKVDDIINMIP